MTRKYPQHNYPCDCGSLERAAENPDNPIVFVEKFNEYQLEYNVASGPAQMMIYFCPFCGGKAPGSIRNRFFARITDEEFNRLRELTKDIKTLEDSFDILGEPEVDSYEGAVTPEKDGKPEVRESFRSLVYSNLSDTAVVRVTDYLGKKVKVRFEGKYTGKER